MRRHASLPKVVQKSAFFQPLIKELFRDLLIIVDTPSLYIFIGLS